MDIAKWLAEHSSTGVGIDIKELLYYQNKTSLLNLTPKRQNQARLAGAYLTRTKGRGMEFDEARHYQPGDDIRAIDWRVTARTGKTHTKLYREEKERPIFVLVDLSSSMYFGTQLLFKSVQAAHLAALIAWAAKQRGDRIGGLIFNQQQHLEFKPMTRQKAVLSLLHGMVEMHQPELSQQSDAQFTDACARIRRLARPGSMVCVISDFQKLDESAKQHLSRLSRHCEVVAYPISDPFEHDLPQVSLPTQVALTDGDQQQILVLGEQQTYRQYHDQHQHQFEQINHRLQQCHAQVLPITCSQPLSRQLIFRGRT